MKKETLQKYATVMIDFSKELAEESDLNKRLLLLLSYGQVANTLNDLLTVIAITEDDDQIAKAIRLVEEGRDKLGSDTEEEDLSKLINSYSSSTKPQA